MAGQGALPSEQIWPGPQIHPSTGHEAVESSFFRTSEPGLLRPSLHS